MDGNSLPKGGCPGAVGPQQVRVVSFAHGWCVLASLFFGWISLQVVWKNRFEASRKELTPLLTAPAFELDINRAQAYQLQALPEIGPRLSQRIVDYRETNGAYQNVEDLLAVRGFGETTLERLKDRLTVSVVRKGSNATAGMEPGGEGEFAGR